MTELNDAMLKAAEKAFDRIWKGAAYQGMAKDAIRAALTAAIALLPKAEQGWQPIETALKDQTFLAVNKDCPSVSYRVVYFDDDAEETYCWHVEDAAKGFNHHRDFFTHWRPLPTPPPAEGQKP